MKTQLYWIRNETCRDVATDGYVGVSKDASRRFLMHKKRNEKIPKDSWFEILFEGTREECFQREQWLRPQKGIGWNRAVGGAQGFKIGFSHSESVRQKLKDAWTSDRRAKAAVQRREQNKKLIGQKRPKQSAAITGQANPMYGKTHSIEAKKKIVEANKGRVAKNRQELYCIGCHERASLHVLSRHQKCWKKYTENKT